jgi:glycosyltransferase involved in cell wall biosynthesis
MKIGVELYHIRDGETGGLVPHVKGVLEAVFTRWPEHEFVLFCMDSNIHLFRTVPPQVQVLHLPPASYYSLVDAQSCHLQIDVLFRTYPLAVDLAFPLSRQVFLIPDFQHHFLPDLFSPEVLESRQRSFSQALRHAGAIGTDTEHSRQTLLAHPDAQTDIFLMGPALPADATTSPDTALTEQEKKQIPTVEYFLYPANLWSHKNHRRTLQAFERFLQQSGRPFELVLTGHPDGWPELAAQFPNLPVRHLGYVRRPLLNELMRRARALVFFSLFEGFGMPLLEAFAAGTPVVCSNSTSLPEVGGDAVLACDPTDVTAMSSALARMASDQELRRTLVERGRGRPAMYRWEDSAARFVAACERLAHSPPVPAGSSLRALHALNKLLAEIETDREARLRDIHQLDAALKRIEAESLARLAALAQLDAENKQRLEAIHYLGQSLKKAEATEVLYQHLLSELQSTRALSRRLARRLLNKMLRVARLKRAA